MLIYTKVNFNLPAVVFVMYVIIYPVENEGLLKIKC